MTSDPSPPPMPETPPEALGAIVRETVLVEGRDFTIHRPTGTDAALNDPAVRAAFAADEYLPYWADLWPAARMLAKVVLREPWVHGTEALEVGCGLGLGGIAALSRGLRVTFSDIDELAVAFAAANARLNGFADFATAALDLRAEPPERYGVILGADLLYEPRMVEPVVGFLTAGLAPGGVALIADPDRISARPFRWAAQQAGLHVEATFARAGEPGGERTKGTVYRITRTV